MMQRRQLFTHFAGAAWAAAATAEKAELSVASASNLTLLAPQLGDAFWKSSGIRPVFSFASTAQLARQVEDGAPFDLFAAADTTHIDALVASKVVTPASRRVYATGILALWFPAGDGSRRRLDDLAAPGIRTIALARPELAPYGAAAVEALRNAGFWDRVKSRLVYAGSVAMAKQYGSTGNADAVFVPKALILREKGSVVVVEERLHAPIEQALAVVAASKRQQAASQFSQFMVQGLGHEILLANGYK